MDYCLNTAKNYIGQVRSGFGVLLYQGRIAEKCSVLLNELNTPPIIRLSKKEFGKNFVYPPKIRKKARAYSWRKKRRASVKKKS